MKKIILLPVVAWLVVAATPNPPVDTPLKGTWKMVRFQYDKEPMEMVKENHVSHKMFTGTRWSAASFDKLTNKINGNCGGTYTIKGDQYKETLDYYSWGNEVVGKTFTFTMTVENGMLHQKGTMEWKGNPSYLIDEWYVRVD
jgi:hypothetical protein